MTPYECRTREDVRQEIDRIDRALVDLLVERFGYIRRMAEIKRDPAEARVAWRVDDVLDKVAARANARGLDSALVRGLWTRLVDWSIDREAEAMVEAGRETSRQA